jgi:two-component system response regulator HydG
MVADSPALSEVLNTIEQVAPTRVGVLIRGETGTGKSLVARAIHDLSPRAAGPFVTVNCAALPETLLEAELFGIEKGVATGVSARRGRLVQADHGTVFLDEIGDMTPRVQASLLRAVQERVVDPVGSSSPVPVDVRFIAATSRDLEALPAAGSFRLDLLHRLSVVEITLPPLRARRDEIPALVEHFVTRYGEEFMRPVRALSAEAMQALLQHDFPGNVRELENAIERAVILARGDLITPNELPPAIVAPPDSEPEPALRHWCVPVIL